jgi:hypothetical protein
MAGDNLLGFGYYYYVITLPSEYPTIPDVNAIRREIEMFSVLESNYYS